MKELCSAGISNRLAVKWVSLYSNYVRDLMTNISNMQSIFREEWIFALLAGQKDLGRHDDCLFWRETIKPRLHERLFTTTGIAVISVQGYQIGDQPTVQSIWAEALELLQGERAIGIACCVAELEHWAHCTLHGLALVQFPV